MVVGRLAFKICIGAKRFDNKHRLVAMTPPMQDTYSAPRNF